MLRLLPKFITVDRDHFKLTLYRMKRNRYVKERGYPIAVGALGHETPAGAYFIEAKLKNPAWVKPASSWIPKEEWNQVIPHDSPLNPLRAWFLKLSGGQGYGIHGTGAEDTIGTAASHGCIRMREPDVIDLAKRVGAGTPVVIY